MPDYLRPFAETERRADARLDAPAFHRNFEPICIALKRLLAERGGDVLEVGSGSGQHAVGFAAAMPALTWWPSDPDAAHLASIAAWRDGSGVTNLKAPAALSVTDAEWRLADGGTPEDLAAIVSLNMIHIAPWAACEGLMRGAGRYLAPDGLLVLYGPFKRDGQHTAPSNASFDQMLQSENPEWGVRDLTAVADVAQSEGLEHAETLQMLANNLVVVFRRA